MRHVITAVALLSLPAAAVAATPQQVLARLRAPAAAATASTAAAPDARRSMPRHSSPGAWSNGTTVLGTRPGDGGGVVSPGGWTVATPSHGWGAGSTTSYCPPKPPACRSGSGGAIVLAPTVVVLAPDRCVRRSVMRR